MTHNISELVKMPESKTLEFKRDLSSLDPIIHTVIAFANSSGGKIVVGVTDGTRELIGVKDPLADEDRTVNSIFNRIAPKVVPNIEMVSENKKTFIIIDVKHSSNRPHFEEAKGIENGTYVRIGASTRKANLFQVRELSRSVSYRSFDREPLLESTISKLDSDFMESTIGKVVPLDEKSIVSLELGIKVEDEIIPTRGAGILFDPHRELYFPDCYVKCARFAGNDKADGFVDQKEIHGSPLVMVEEIEQFIKRHASKAAKFEGLKRIDQWEVHFEILREFLMNMFLHADYSVQGAPFRVEFCDNRIVMSNPGMLVPGQTFDGMAEGVSIVRNHVIAKVFDKMNLVEGWGYGMRAVKKFVKESGLKPPEFSENSSGVVVTMFLEKIDSDANEAARRGHMPHSDDTASHSDRTLTKQDIMVLRYVKQKPRTREELLEKIGVKNYTRSFDRHIRPLMDAKLIQMSIPDKPQSVFQEYCITELGEKRLAELRI